MKQRIIEILQNELKQLIEKNSHYKQEMHELLSMLIRSKYHIIYKIQDFQL